MSSKPEAVIDLIDFGSVELTDQVIDLTKSEREEELPGAVAIPPSPDSPIEWMEPGVPGPSGTGELLRARVNHPSHTVPGSSESNREMESIFAELYDMPWSPLRAADRNNSRKRVLKELAEYERSDKASLNYTIEYKDENMYEWIVRIKKLPEECDLAKSLDKNGIKEVVIKFIFPQRYPNIPPIVGLMEPIIKNPYISACWMFCIDVLLDAWNPEYSVETILAHIMQALQMPETEVVREPFQNDDDRLESENMLEKFANSINNL